MSLAFTTPLGGLLDNVNGIPSHPLIVHFAIAFAVAGSLGGLGYALVPKWRRWLNVPLIFVGLGSIVLGLITPPSGDSLAKRVPYNALVQHHEDLGGQMGTIMIVYGVVLVVAMLVARYAGSAPEGEVTTIDRVGGFPGTAHRAFPGQQQLAAFLTFVVLVLAIVSVIWIYRTGDAGAKAAWHGTPTTPEPGFGNPHGN